MRRQKIKRPMPPNELLENPFSGLFLPAPEVVSWIQSEILDEDAQLFNADHVHLKFASIGVLWTCVENSRRGHRVVGQAEQPIFMCGQWQKARQELQMRQWFGCVPDFVITLNADYCAMCSDVEFCMLIEHELYHCAQKRDAFGQPKFYKESGLPQFTLVGHDVEEFIGVVARYGTGSPDSPLSKLVAAANSRPSVARASIAAACGTCLLKAA